MGFIVKLSKMRVFYKYWKPLLVKKKTKKTFNSASLRIKQIYDDFILKKISMCPSYQLQLEAYILLHF